MAGDGTARRVPFDGVVLCGGESRRMGRDKALLEIGGRPMASRVADALEAAGASSVVAQGGDRPGLEALGLRFVADQWPGGGPFPAVVQAVETSGESIVAVLGCDLVSPDVGAIGAIIDALGDEPSAAGAVPVIDGREQWVHAAWRRTSAPLLRAALDGGHRSLRRAAVALPIVRLTGLGPAVVADADHPGELPGAVPSRRGDEGGG